MMEEKKEKKQSISKIILDVKNAMVNKTLEFKDGLQELSQDIDHEIQTIGKNLNDDK